MLRSIVRSISTSIGQHFISKSPRMILMGTITLSGQSETIGVV